jgi:hypothetical protein
MTPIEAVFVIGLLAIAAVAAVLTVVGLVSIMLDVARLFRRRKAHR